MEDLGLGYRYIRFHDNEDGGTYFLTEELDMPHSLGQRLDESRWTVSWDQLIENKKNGEFCKVISYK